MLTTSLTAEHRAEAGSDHVPKNKYTFFTTQILFTSDIFSILTAFNKLVLPFPICEGMGIISELI